jgi:hypothetical protein
VLMGDLVDGPLTQHRNPLADPYKNPLADPYKNPVLEQTERIAAMTRSLQIPALRVSRQMASRGTSSGRARRSMSWSSRSPPCPTSHPSPPWRLWRPRSGIQHGARQAWRADGDRHPDERDLPMAAPIDENGW